MKLAYLVRNSFAIILLLSTVAALAAPAARVEFATGPVTAESRDGAVRSLTKGATVNAGDTVNTNEGRAQLRFTDDGFVSLHSQTIFRIDEYEWKGVHDGSERGFFSLLKGGLRTLTGKLAKQNRKAYAMTTAVATIGIRGTEYTMQLNGSLVGAVAEGEIEVCNSAGCLGVSAGQSYLVRDVNSKPVLSTNQTLLSPPAPLSNGSLMGANPSGLDATSLLGTFDSMLGQLLEGSGLTQPVQGVTGSAIGFTSQTLRTLDATTDGLSGLAGGLGETTGTASGGSLLNLLSQ